MSDPTRRSSSASERPDPLVGTVLAERYKVLGLVAKGGMGRVYRAEQLGLGRVVALKVLASSELEDPEHTFRKRFEREAAICARLTHPNTVRVYDSGWTADDLCFIAMEFVNGRTLQEALLSEAPFPAARVVHILKQIAGSLGEAHDQGVMHRDLKPGNVLLAKQGDDRDFVKVVDFGLVKHEDDEPLTQTGVIVGSPMFMSPEQVRGVEVDHRTDVYALGVIAYVMITGRRPFEKDTAIAVMMARLNSPPRPMREAAPEVVLPASLEWVVSTALATDADDRFASMHEVIRALRVCEAELRGDATIRSFAMRLDHGRTVTPPDFQDPSQVRRTVTPVPMARKTPRSSRAATAGLSVLAVVLMGLLGVACAAVLLLLYFLFAV